MAEPASGEPRATLHASARREIVEATRFYLKRDPRVAERFVNATDRTMRMILAGPERWPPYLHGTRRCLVPHFPYEVIYRLHEAGVHVIAVAHTSRNPGYWKARR